MAVRNLATCILAMGLIAHADTAPGHARPATPPDPAASAPAPHLPPGAVDLGSDTTWTALGTVHDALGRHTRWAQHFKGIPVLGSELISHELDGTVLPPTYPLALGRGARGVPFVPPILGGGRPVLSEDKALEALSATFGPLALKVLPAKVRRVYFPVMRRLDLARPGETDALAMPRLVSGYLLAYEMEVRWSGQPGAPRDAAYVLDARTGRILDQRPLALGLGRPGRFRAMTRDHGAVDLDVRLLDGEPRVLLQDPRRGSGGGNTVEDLLGQWDPDKATIITLGGDAEGEAEQTAASAAHGLAAAWDYFEKVHGRHGYDDRGTPVRVFLNNPTAGGTHWEILQGVGTIHLDAPGKYLPMVDLETLGHEFTHGVVGTRAKLDRSPEARGLAEGTCDFFGQMIRTWSTTGGGNPASRLFGNLIGDRGTTWTMPMPRMAEGGPALPLPLRDMAEPARVAGHPDRWTPELESLHDEHWIAGPLNRALCFLSRGAAALKGAPEALRPRGSAGAPSWSSELLEGGMRGIGNDRTAAIWYAAVNDELQPMSDYRDARRAALKVARALYGEDSTEDLAVRDAFGAVGVGKPGRLAEPSDAWLPAVTVSAEVRGEDVHLAVEVPDTAEVASMAFLVDGVLVGKAHARPYRLRLPASRRLANGAHRFQAVLRDREDSVLRTAEAGFTLANRQQQLLDDPSLVLEDPDRGWLTDASLESATPPPAAEGALGWCRRFDGVTLSPGKMPFMSTALTLPGAPTRLQLSLWVQVPASARPGAGDELCVRVQPRDGAPEVLARLTAAAASPEWRHLAFPLDAFAGQSIELQFESRFAAESTTVFRVADVRVLASPDPFPGPPAAPAPAEAKTPVP